MTFFAVSIDANIELTNGNAIYATDGLQSKVSH